MNMIPSIGIDCINENDDVEEDEISIGESDVSDFDNEDFGNDEGISNWLEEEDDETEFVSSTPVTPSIEIPNSPYIQANKMTYLSLIEVEDLNFQELSIETQEELIQTLSIEIYKPNDVIFEEGSSSLDMYFIIRSEDPTFEAEVEVVKRAEGEKNDEKKVTRLTPGQYFGQKYFLTKRVRQRSATIRVPKESECAVHVAKLVPEYFASWSFYRNTLLIKAAPLIQMLPKQECNEIIDKMHIKEFAPGEYIIRQGELGQDFFIIREGSVKIIDETFPQHPKILTTLKEGHFFGEMALVTDEPRVASVVALDATICLTLTKAAFTSALSESTFSNVLSQVLEQRRLLREERSKVTSHNMKIENNSSAQYSPNNPSSLHLSNPTTNTPTRATSYNSATSEAHSSGFNSPVRMQPGSARSSTGGQRRSYSRHPSKYSLSEVSGSLPSEENASVTSHFTAESEVIVTSRVTMKKLSSGCRLINNKYLVLKELGKGAFGEVFLCKDEETGLNFAMKVINRNPSASGNDDITSSIRREVAVMKRLRHENVVSLHEVIDDPSVRKIFLIQEYMEGGSLLPDHEIVDHIGFTTENDYYYIF